MPIIVDEPLAPGTGVELCAVWLNDAADPSDLCAFEYAGDAISFTVDGRAEVRQLINRRRVIRRGSRAQQSLSFSLPEVTPAQAAWLRAHVGQILCVRDHVGTKVHAVYLDLPLEVETDFRSRRSAKISLEQVSFSEAV